MREEEEGWERGAEGSEGEVAVLHGTLTWTNMWPSRVNLMELPTRLTMTWRRRLRSPMTTSGTALSTRAATGGRGEEEGRSRQGRKRKGVGGERGGLGGGGCRKRKGMQRWKKS